MGSSRRLLVILALAVAVVVAALVLRQVLGGWSFNRSGAEERQREYEKNKAAREAGSK